MTDDIRALTTRLAEEPGSLAFLDLGETLRRRDQLDAALKIARGGVSRYPALANAHDLLARILCDRGELAGAFEAWADALRLDPMHPAALKGIGFLYYRSGDVSRAHQYLERALEADPDDLAIPAALARMSAGAIAAPSMPLPEAEVARPPDDETGQLLVDGQGLRLRGTLLDSAQHDVSDAVAAELAGVSKEAARTTRLLRFGAWESITAESPDGCLVLVPPTAETVQLVVQGANVPAAHLGLLADRAARDARTWLERER